jgi:hypothetical protein
MTSLSLPVINGFGYKGYGYKFGMSVGTALNLLGVKGEDMKLEIGFYSFMDYGLLLRVQSVGFGIRVNRPRYIWFMVKNE